MPTLTVYSTSSDGHLMAVDLGGDYDAAHDSATANGELSASGQTFAVGQNLSGGDNFRIYRAGLFFDTSALPSDAVISTATLSLYGNGDYSSTDFNITVVSGSDLADPIVTTNYGDLLDDVTSMGTVNTSGFTTSDYNNITLNATGKAAISKTGTTKFALRSDEDINDSQNAGSEYVSVWASEESGKQPKLVIVYATSPTVTTQTCEALTDTTATGRGNVTNLGGGTVSAHGHCWKTSADPTTSDSKDDNGATSATGTFRASLSSLIPGTAYYTRAFATNEAGTSYGANVYFIASTLYAGDLRMVGSNLTGYDANAVQRTYIHTDDVDDTPVDAATTAPISSNWAYDHAAVKAANATLGHVIVETGSLIDVDGNGKLTLGAHQTTHSPNDGSDALDCAAPAELASVQAAGEGNADTLARSNHQHQIQASIADNHIVTIDYVTPVEDDYAKFTASGLKGLSVAEALADLSPLSTRGDIMFRNATVDTRLAKGADNTILAMGANDPEWKTPAVILGDLTGADFDVGAFDVRGQTVTADGLTAGRVVFTGVNGVLSDNAGFLFGSDTLTVAKIGAFEATGAINFASQTLTNIILTNSIINGTINSSAGGLALNVGANTFRINTTNSADGYQIWSTQDGGAGAYIITVHNSASPADGDIVFAIQSYANTSGIEYVGRYDCVLLDASTRTAGWTWHLRNAGTWNTPVMTLSGAGELWCDTYVNPDDGVKVSGTQVVAAQGVAVANAAEDLGEVTTQLNLLLARCRAHGLIAT